MYCIMSSNYSTVFWCSLYIRTQHGSDDDVEYREEDENEDEEKDKEKDEEKDEEVEAEEDGMNTTPHRYFMQEQGFNELEPGLEIVQVQPCTYIESWLRICPCPINFSLALIKISSWTGGR